MKATSLMNAMLVGVLLCSAGQALAGENQGSPSIVLKGGSMGSITFPHGLHQHVFVDCKPCHELFAKEPNAIENMKATGKLRKQEVMNMCKGCHKDMQAKGKKTGPTVCTDCHKK